MSNGQIVVKKEKKNAPKKLVAPKPFVPKTEPLSPTKAIKRENASPSKGNSPKRARSSYAFFISYQMKTEDGTDNRTKMTKANERWKELPADQKSVYERMAAEDKVRYERELAAYKLQQVWQLTQFFSVSFLYQINDPRSGKYFSLSFLPATPTSPSQAFEDWVFELTQRPS